MGKARNQEPAGWHSEDIKAAIRKTGITLTQLALMNGLSESACRMALCKPCKAAEYVIAAYLRVPLHELWPLRYHRDGSRRRHLWSSARNDTRRRAAVERQNGKAA